VCRRAAERIVVPEYVEASRCHLPARGGPIVLEHVDQWLNIDGTYEEIVAFDRRRSRGAAQAPAPDAAEGWN